MDRHTTTSDTLGRSEAARAAGIVEFHLTDADGVEHRYEVQRFEGSEGSALVWKLMAQMGGPLGHLLKGAVVPLLDGDVSLNELMDDSEALATILRGVDMGGVGKDLAQTLEALKMPRFQKKLLARTFRDGKLLADSKAFDSAYKANYMELMMALWEVVRANRMLPF